MKTDAVDAKILRALMDDGRASLREIARRTALTTPTVSARMARMRKAGLIKKFVPVLATGSAGDGVEVQVTLRATPSSAERVAGTLAALSNVHGVFVTDQGLNVRVVLNRVGDIHSFLNDHALTARGVEVVSTQIVTKAVKDELAPPVLGTLNMDLRCDYCGGAVLRSMPYTISTGALRYYFCCNVCRKAYLDKFGSRLKRLSAGRTALRS